MAVGFLLVGLFFVQCTQHDHPPATSLAKAISLAAPPKDGGPSGRAERLRQLAETDHIALLDQALAHCRQNVHDFRCEFRKQECINGRLGQEQSIQVKFRRQPFSVAMTWLTHPPSGDRLLYVDGERDGKMVIRPKAPLVRLAFPTILLAPDSAEAMAATLRPVTAFGFERMLESLLKVYRLAASRNEGANTFMGYRDVFGRQVLALERVLPERKDYPAKRTVCYLDSELLVPLGVVSYDWDGRLIGSYLFKDVQINVGLTADDFAQDANGMQASK